MPDGPSCLLAVTCYRGPEHGLFHRDASFTVGSRVRRSREMRAMAHRTEFGRAPRLAQDPDDVLAVLGRR